MPTLDYYIEKGMPEKDAKKRVQQDVFGDNFKKDGKGRPVESGIGSAARPTEQHFQALERAEGKEVADKARREARPAKG